MSLQRLLWAVIATALFLSPAHAAYDVGDIICETSTTTGTGTLNLGGAVTNYATFISQITSGSSVNYHITASDGTLETGVGVLTDAAPDTLTRVAYWSTDGSGAELTLPAGTHTVCLGPTTQMFAGMKGFQLYTDDAGAVGGILPFWHDSASAADGDIAGEIQIWGGADDEEIGQIRMEVDDGATTTEDTQWQFVNRVAGADLTSLTLGTTGSNGVSPSHVFLLPGTNYESLEVQSTAAGVGGPEFHLYQNSATPLAGDVPGGVYIDGEDSAGNFQNYGGMYASIVNPTSTSEDSSISFQALSAGSALTALTLGGTDANFGFGHQFSFGSAAGELSVQSSVDGVVGPGIITYHNDPSADANDFVGFWDFYGEDSAGNTQQYGGIGVRITDTTSTSEDSRMYFDVFSGGSTISALSLQTTSDASSTVIINTASGLLDLENGTDATWREWR
jgi:hypothetical protein